MPTVVGVGIDVVGIDRFADAMERTPRLKDRLFSPEEIVRPDGAPLGAASLAARFAAKEAVAKVLVRTGGLAWTECQVRGGPDGEPHLELHGRAKDAADALGIARWHLSLSHDGGIAAAIVVAESP